MPEWSNGAVSKTVVRLRTVGSNPTPSARLKYLFLQYYLDPSMDSNLPRNFRGLARLWSSAVVI